MVVPIGGFSIGMARPVCIGAAIIEVIVVGGVAPAVTFIAAIIINGRYGQTGIGRIAIRGVIGDDHAVAGGQYSGDEHQANG